MAAGLRRAGARRPRRSRNAATTAAGQHGGQRVAAERVRAVHDELRAPLLIRPVVSEAENRQLVSRWEEAVLPHLRPARSVSHVSATSSVGGNTVTNAVANTAGRTTRRNSSSATRRSRAKPLGPTRPRRSGFRRDRAGTRAAWPRSVLHAQLAVDVRQVELDGLRRDQNSFAIWSFERPRARAPRIVSSRSVSPSDLALERLLVHPEAVWMFPRAPGVASLRGHLG